MGERWGDEDRRRDERARYGDESRGGQEYGRGGRHAGSGGGDWGEGPRRGPGRGEDRENWRGQDRGNPPSGSRSPAGRYSRDEEGPGGNYGLGGSGQGYGEGGYGPGAYGEGGPGQGGDGPAGYDRGMRSGGGFGEGSRGRWAGTGEEQGYGRGRDYGEGERGRERGMWDRAADEVSSWFGDDDAERRRRMDAREVGHHRGRGPKGYTRSDERIRDDVSDRLSDDPMVDASDIEVTVSEREVTLSGTVDSRGARRRAEDVAESVSGVSYVQNNLRVKRQGESMSAGTDSIAKTAPSGSGIESTTAQPGTVGSTDR